LHHRDNDFQGGKMKTLANTDNPGSAETSASSQTFSTLSDRGNTGSARQFCFQFIVVAILSLVCVSALWAGVLDTNQLFLAPSAVPVQIYTPISLNLGNSDTISGSFSAVNMLPLLKPDPNTSGGQYTNADFNRISLANYSQYYAYTPTVDYSANLSSSGVTLTFNQPGSYFVRLVSGGQSSFLYFQIDDGWFPIDGNSQVSGPERQWTPPPADLNVVSQGEDDAGQAAVTNRAAGLPRPGNTVRADDIDSVVNAIKKASQNAGHKISVNLVGHGAPGAIQFGNEIIGDAFNMTAKEFQKEIDPYVNKITFISCNTASGAKGGKFLTDIHSSIDGVAGFSFPITVHDDGFDLNAKGGLSLPTPEPSTLLMLGSGLLGLRGFFRRRLLTRC
jgi:hypothetical protein